MNEHDTAERQAPEQDQKEGGMPTNIIVTVAPGNPNPNKEVPCSLHVAPPQYLVDDAIWLDPTQDYNITFNLPGGGQRTWDTTGGSPFCNQKGQCPSMTAGTQNGFSVTGKGPYAMTVYVPSQGGRGVQHYRMNFDNGYTCDPIIVVG